MNWRRVLNDPEWVVAEVAQRRYAVRPYWDGISTTTAAGYEAAYIPLRGIHQWVRVGRARRPS